jgi:imidazolonepropionase-like amidohydrolase
MRNCKLSLHNTRKAYKMAVAAGVKIALGTDLGLGGVNPSKLSYILGYGNNGQELVYAVEVGMAPDQAIEAATANAPATLGPQAPLSGELKVGYDADIILLPKSPLNDIDVLANPDNVTHVWKGGRLLKSP